MLRYTLMRLGIFAGCLVVVWGLVYSGVAPRGLGASNGMWVVLLALVISAPISFVVLRKERDRASIQVEGRIGRDEPPGQGQRESSSRNLRGCTCPAPKHP
ncbi:hypothetical protein SALBM311S_04528 [Streptomyces alboniger]